MKRIAIERQGTEGALELDWQETDDVLAFLAAEFGESFPPAARIYHGEGGGAEDVTPDDAAGVARLAQLPGPFVVVLWPQDPGSLTLGAQLFLTFAAFVIQGILAPTPPTVTQRNVRNESPNNGLSERTNQVRVNGRIPDIFGTVRSTPDLIQVPYKIFEEHVEKEIAYMCIGRGRYAINASEIYDDTTPMQEIAGASVAVYGPGTSPNSGAPQLTIGNAINQPVLKISRLNAVNGQVLLPSDAGGSYRNAVRFESPNIVRSMDPEVDFTTLFLPGDPLTIAEAVQSEGTFTYQGMGVRASMESGQGVLRVFEDISADWAPGQRMTIANSGFNVLMDLGESGSGYTYGTLDGIYTIDSVTWVPPDPFDPSDTGHTVIRLLDVEDYNPFWLLLTGGTSVNGYGEGQGRFSRPSGVVQFDLSGTYSVNTVSADVMTLSSPASVNPDWTVMADDYGGQSQVLNPLLFTSGDRWVGEFTLRSNEPIRRLVSNFVAQNGLFADNGSNQYVRTVDVRLEATPVDAAGDPIGTTEGFNGTVVGSATTRSTRALTMDVPLAGTSSIWKVRARRLTPKDLDFSGTVVDEIKWRDLYSATPVTEPHFGDVTTIQVANYATDGALAVKERKTNLIVTRMLPAWTGSEFTAELYPTRDLADILAFVALDPKIGGRAIEEIDVAQFYAIQQEIKNYFGFDEAAHFSYTFDNSNLSPEETIATIAEAVYCSAYRRGSLIRLHFERETDESVLLFNHRNKVPGSDVVRQDFGNVEGFDGIEYKYVAPEDDAPVTLYLPEDQSATKPRSTESVGIRDHRQAHIHAWRLWNKLRYQNMALQFTALPEANLLTLKERALWVDNTRSGSQDGEVVAVDGLTLTLSQSLDWWVDGAEYSIQLQGADGRVEAIDIVRGPGPRQIVLDHAPQVPVVVDDTAYVRTAYVITDNAGARNALPVLVTEKGEPNDDTTIPITAINYDGRYYQNDRDFLA